MKDQEHDRKSRAGVSRRSFLKGSGAAAAASALATGPGSLTLRSANVNLNDDPGLYRPQVGDQLLELAGHRTRTFVEFSQALVWLRSPPEVSATGEPLVGSLNPGTPLTIDPSSTLCVQEFRGHPEWGRFAKVRFRRGG